MTSLDSALDYRCIVEDSDFPVVKLCQYTSDIPRKTELLSNDLEKGDLFALIKLNDVPTFYEGSWISISFDEIQELKVGPDHEVVEVVENSYSGHSHRHEQEDLGCALCNTSMQEADQYKLIYGYHIVNFHEECFNEFREKLIKVVEKSDPELVSHTI